MKASKTLSGQRRGRMGSPGPGHLASARRTLAAMAELARANQEFADLITCKLDRLGGEFWKGLRDARP